MSGESTQKDLQSLGTQALSFHQKGQLAEAEDLYLRILKFDPHNFNALYLLGLVRQQQDRSAEAIELVGAALKINPGSTQALLQHGLLLESLGYFDEALADFDRVLAINPDDADALYNKGVTLGNLRRFGDALTCYEKALAIDPDNPDTSYNRGTILMALKRPAEALESFDRALAVKPDFTEAWNNRGNMLRDAKRPVEALESYGRALALAPDYVVARHNRATLLHDLRRFDEALAEFDGIVRLEPEFAEAWSNRGNLLRDMKRFAESLASYDRALAIRPDDIETLIRRGTLQWGEYLRYEAAARDLEKAVGLAPDHDYVLGDYLHLRAHGADWRDFERELSLLEAGVRAGKRVARPFMYQGVSHSPADLLACARTYALHRYPAGKAVWKTRRHAKIRLGYVSGEFHAQATAYLMAGLYERHDKARFELVAFDNGPKDQSLVRKRLEAAFDKFIGIANLSDRAAAERIRDEEIDILVNLNGYFGKDRMAVFALKPAPIQVNYLGFPGTLGADYIDYILADRLVIPEQDRKFYAEHVVWLPDSYQVNDSARAIAPVIPSRTACGLPEDAFVFCSFNQGYKLMPAMFAVWMRILNQVEGSVLWLLKSNEAFAENLRREAENHGISRERLVFAPMISLEEHLARLKRADLFLDSLPSNAHTTASDALWAGLPLVTCRGGSFSGRVAASLLHAVGLPELVTESLEDYEALVLRLARDPALLRAIREKLAQNRLTMPLFDTDRFRRHIESAYTKMRDIFERGEAPRSFSIEPLAD